MRATEFDQTVRHLLSSREPRSLAGQTLFPEKGPPRDSAVLVPFFFVNNEPHILFTQRTEHLSSHSGHVSFPGGRCDEEDEDAVATALRETEEEVGIPKERIEVLGVLDDIFSGSNYRITPIVARIDYPIALVPSDYEIKQLIPAPISALMDERRFRWSRNDWQGQTFNVYYFHYSDPPIWGATARITYQLLKMFWNWNPAGVIEDDNVG